VSPLERITAIRTGGEVERCHGIRHQGSYSNAAHTWGVLVLLHVLWPEDFPRLAAAVLYHDVPEAWVGDIPAPTKRYNQVVKMALELMEYDIFKMLGLPDADALPPPDLAKVKAADRLELYFWAKEQVAQGNQHAEGVLKELDQFFELDGLPEPAGQLYLQLRHKDVVHSTFNVIREMNK
jgi:5'-deoxynucleotidase YfbR-like HD superfamily hydrolase